MAFIDLTEPEPMQLGETLVQDDKYLWRVELYLMSKYQPEFVEATIFKVRSAALERAKIVKEHHSVLKSLSELQRAIETDLSNHVQWMPKRTHRAASYVKRPNISGGYQKEFNDL